MATSRGYCSGVEASIELTMSIEVVTDVQFLEQQRDQATRPREIFRMVNEELKDLGTMSTSPDVEWCRAVC